ncbi:MAG: Dolichyl-phosphate-mannose-protein mannosyltransferase family protein [Candidatus Shapirobacteria bacterium GW2011_GWE1_38_10]|uniref:Dolichyl-phosphate-mannose-protein mannosyltransferase family protein n=1 Tax=Candidatus Shapirobacteria bacterium GW2011_GWE1_38_10 TaxID=1618488 RepID=A0A0G0I2D4_9BACT|nr:MAG: Dolichyl-phosphate-mannose-protein mannosyltransferase family protein [Candidatus Shapirobacteria bacterium GW2011_GWE1_38_10]
MKLFAKYLPLIILLGVASGLLLYRLDNSRLFPWDEAWYATIARNIYRSGDVINLTFNSKPFWDHPPLGFLLISLSYRLFGVGELSARLPMAFAGIALVCLTYQTAWRMTGKRRIGLIAGLVLLSSRWFLIRARTANLEALLLLTQLGVFYLSVFAKKYKDLYPLWLVFGLSLLVKSVISVTLFPLVAIATFLVLKKGKRIRLNFLVPLFLVASPWYLVNGLKYGWPFFERNIFEIALRGKGGFKTGFEEIKRTLLYFRSAVHKWYWPSILSSAWGLLRLRDSTFKWLLLYLAITTIPYFASPTTHIWHLLPMIPAISLMIGCAAKSVSEIAPIATKEYLIWFSLLGVVVISLISINSYRPFLYQDKTESYESRLALSSTRYDYPLYLQDTSYVPTVVFYADRYVEIIRDEKNLAGSLIKPFQIITKDYLIRDLGNSYNVVDRFGDSVLAIFE